MAKKAKKQNKKTQDKNLPVNALPQNILPMGERVEEDKNIYISQSVYKQIHKFTKNKTTNESGGMLVGSVIEEFGKTNIVISGFVEAKFSQGTPTTLTFTHETWDYVHKEIEKKYKGQKIVGWIHTHPNFGIFLSEYDKFIHQNFFGEAHQIAYVVDPIQNEEGFYFWINGNLTRCNGFYIYEKNGTQIAVDTEKDAPETKESTGFSWKDLLLAVMSIAMVFLIFTNVTTNSKLEDLEKRQEELENQQYMLVGSANSALEIMQQVIIEQQEEIKELKDALIEAGLIAPPEKPENSDTSNETGEGSESE